jgi:hypothetical protein
MTMLRWARNRSKWELSYQPATHWLIHILHVILTDHGYHVKIRVLNAQPSR